ncbi:MAG: long-chain fatty acid--CoA ligase [Actinobacteria bacterium]|nr:long-chain fatty acid--CoA ligase [Actinomycetota bacterium]
MNIADALDRNVIFFPDNEALVDGGRRWTYREFRRDADRFAHALTDLGVGHGDRVGLFMGNCAEFAIAFYGALKVGAIVVSLSSMCKCGEIEYMVTHSTPRVLVVGGANLGEVPARAAIPSVEHVVVVGGGAGGPADHAFWDLLAGRPDHFATVYTDREEGAEIIYTGGTTGAAKGVLLTHGNVVSNTNTNVHLTGLTPEDRLICFLPLYHSFAQNFIFNVCVNRGATLVILPKFEVESVLRTMREERVTRWYAVPTIYIMVLDVPDADEAFAHVNYCFSAAASMPVEVARRWKERFGLVINEGYGLTESTPSATYNHQYRHKAGTVGTPIDNVEVQIWDADNRPLPPGEVGEIVIKGPNVMKGYYNNPEATAAALVDGWLKTGDVGVMDEEGYITLVDRLKDMVNSAGLKIWPREVEEVLYQHEAVLECAVIGVPDPVYGETVKACVVVRPGVELCADDIVSYCKARLASYKAPRIVEFMEALPKSPAGKILKTELRKTAGEKA